MPTMDRKPPPVRLKKAGDHSSSSPVRRRSVIPRVISAGTRMSCRKGSSPARLASLIETSGGGASCVSPSGWRSISRAAPGDASLSGRGGGIPRLTRELQNARAGADQVAVAVGVVDAGHRGPELALLHPGRGKGRLFAAVGPFPDGGGHGPGGGGGGPPPASLRPPPA